MYWWQVILFPFSVLYHLGSSLRNHLYNVGYSKIFDFEVNVISVGNLSVGGTGKSPMVFYLAEILRSQSKRIAVLSRGYRRKTRGQVLASDNTNASELGDEPLMTYRRFRGEVPVAVSEDRALGVPGILLEYPETDVILLDDAFQHRRIGRNCNILLTTYDRPFFSDHVLPAGLLRESRTGANRADIIVITKCPIDVSLSQKQRLEKECEAYAPDAEVFFTAIQYGKPVGFRPGHVPNSFVAVSGIAQNDSFISWCEEHCSLKSKQTFPDHHRYSKQDILKIASEMEGGPGLLTTEKDFVKLSEFKELDQSRCFYIPIEMKFLERETAFKDLIMKSMRQYKDFPAH